MEIKCGSALTIEELLLTGLFHDNGDGTFTANTTDLTALITAINAVKTSSDLGNVPLTQIAGLDFLLISDANPHTGLDCYMIFVMSDAVFSSIVVGGSNVVAAKGLTGVTVTAGTLLPFGKTHATAITLTSGKVIEHEYT